MQFSDWSLKAIRDEGACFSWMEEYRFNWIAQVQNAILQILDGQSAIIVTDKEYSWLSKYITQKINQTWKNRPFFPVYTIDGIFANTHSLNEANELDFLNDMLDISFANGYFFWYIGEGKHNFYDYIEQSKKSLIWHLNKDVEGLFSLNKKDPLVDIKLIQSYNLFDKALDATFIGEIEF